MILYSIRTNIRKLQGTALVQTTHYVIQYLDSIFFGLPGPNLFIYLDLAIKIYHAAPKLYIVVT